jgi:hypothetical protein
MPKKKAIPEAPSIYQFTPNDQPHPIDRSIVFEPGEGGNHVLTSTSEGSTTERPHFKLIGSPRIAVKRPQI